MSSQTESPLFFQGVFRPPVDGVYVLTFYGMPSSSDGGHVSIKRNDDILCRAWLTSEGTFDTATCTVVAELTTDDSVRVTGDSSDPSALEGDSWSGFTGFLIYDS